MAHLIEEKGGSKLEHVQLIEGDGWTDASDHIGCCDCGLVHSFDVRLLDNLGRVIIFPEGFRFQIKLSRDVEETRLARETGRFVCSLEKRGEGNGN